MDLSPCPYGRNAHDPFSQWLASVAADLAAGLIERGGGRLRQQFQDEPRRAALKRATQAALAVLAQRLTQTLRDDVHARQLLGYVEEFLRVEDVQRELSGVLRGRAPDRDELLYQFEALGYDPNTLGLPLDTLITILTGSLLAAAAAEPDLQGGIQTGQLMAQTRLQQEMVAALRTTVGLLRESVDVQLALRDGALVALEAGGTQRLLLGAAAEPEPPPATQVWETHYLSTVIAQCEQIDVAAIDDMTADTPVGVSDVFTTLYLRRGQHVWTRREDQSTAEALDTEPLEEPPDGAAVATRDDRPRGHGDDTPRVPITALEALGERPRAVILGAPGGGKSTLVNYLAVRAARWRLETERPAANGAPPWLVEEAPLPVRILLRRLAAFLPDKLLPGKEAGAVWDYVAQALRDSGCGEAFESLKRYVVAGGGLILFDGLDEVRQVDAANKRESIVRAIDAFTAALPPSTRVVVTCREYAYRPEAKWRLPEARFPVFELALFQPDQIARFTELWYAVTGQSKGWGSERRRDEARLLAERINARPHLRELGQYPLLLTLMAQMHGREGTIPENRADLYERATVLLLDRWENRLARDAGLPAREGEVLQLDERVSVLREVLEVVAYAAHTAQETAADRDERTADIRRDALWDALAVRLDGSYDRAKRVTEFIQNRAGLLVARDNHTYAFPHRTFQEFLAAAYVRQRPDPAGVLRDLVRRDPAWWREVFLLAVGQMKTVSANVKSVVDRLVTESSAAPLSARRAAEARLAAQALHETEFVAKAVREGDEAFVETVDRVRRALMAALGTGRLPAAERAACGRSLAQIGDTRRGVGARRVNGVLLPDIEWCYVPPGPFWMGSPDDDPEAHAREKPLHTVDLPYGYWIARYPVTVAQWRLFVEASGYSDFDRDSLRDPDNHPARWLSWDDGVAFCRWLTDALRGAGQLPDACEALLPSEAEWEKAARGGIDVLRTPHVVHPGGQMTAPEGLPMRSQPEEMARRRYVWGDEQQDAAMANYKETGLGDTCAVGAFPANLSPVGAADLLGNVWEWTRSRWGENFDKPDFGYPYELARLREAPDSRDWRVLRGGAFWNSADALRCAYRFRHDPYFRSLDLGFRVCLSPFFSLYR